MNSGPGNARDFESEALSARREAMLEDESPHHEFQAPTAASRSRHLATTTMLPGYASLLNLRRAQDTAFVMAVSNPNLRRGHSNRIAGDDIAEANERRPLDVTTGIVNGVPSFIARRRLNDDRRITYGASLREHGDSMNFRATSMNDLREEGRHRATHGFSNLNPARGVRQDERNLLRTTLEDEHSMGSMRGIERMRSSSDEVGRSEALDSHDPELVARWMHQQSLAELHELMMHLVELGGSDLRAHQARCMMAEIIQRRRQQRQSFMNELDRNDMDFAAEVGPILRVLDAQDSVQIMHLIKLRRETREAIAEVERPGRSDAPSPSAIQDSWEEMMVSGGWERMGRRRRS
ncbi:hypothetical protein EG327_004159 [Venturia inaequalis]|nr:hypothetical protein EG327_004159 [Venturia inaequalis]